MTDHVPSPPEIPTTTVIVVPREAHSPWPEMLETLIANTDLPYRLVVVDGGSPRKVARAIEQLAVRHDFTLIRSDALLTSNEARNLGMRHVATEFVAFLDNDTFVPAGWLAGLEQCARETGAPLVSPTVLAGGPGAWEIHAGGGDAYIEGEGSARRFVERNALRHCPPSDLDGAVRQPSAFVELHCLLARVDVVRLVEPFDEGYLAGREHNDLVFRVAERGGTPLLEPAIAVRYASRKHLSLHDYSFYLPRWSDEWARASFAHFNERWGLHDTSIDDWFLRGTLARRLQDRYRTRTGLRLWSWRVVRRARRAIDMVATPAALKACARNRARCDPARVAHRATWLTA